MKPTWSKQLVESSLKMLKDNLTTLHMDELDAQDKVVVELTMHNLFTNIMTACKVIRNIKKEVKTP